MRISPRSYFFAAQFPAAFKYWSPQLFLGVYRVILERVRTGVVELVCEAGDGSRGYPRIDAGGSEAEVGHDGEDKRAIHRIGDSRIERECVVGLNWPFAAAGLLELMSNGRHFASYNYV